MPKHFRIFWGSHVGRTRLNLYWPPTDFYPVVTVSATEGDANTAPATLFVGNANFTVSNIAPRFDGVSFVVNIDWFEPLYLWTDVTMFDENDPLEFLRAIGV